MNAVRKQLSLINKNAFQKSMIKLTWDQDMKLAKEKHFEQIINTLLGQNEKMTQEEGTKIIIDYLLQLDVKKWMKSLKTLMVIHRILNIIPKKLQPILSQYIDSANEQGNTSNSRVNDNNQKTQINQEIIISKESNNNNSNPNDQFQSTYSTMSKDSKSIPDSNRQRQNGSIPRNTNRNIIFDNNIKMNINLNNTKNQIDLLHQLLVQKYYDYVIIFSEKLDNINYLAGKEIINCNIFAKEFTKIKSLLILFKHVHSFMRELELSLSSFQKVIAVQYITCLLSNNLMQAYQILKPIIITILKQYDQFENPTDFIRFYNFYSDFITITKYMQKFNVLKGELNNQFEQNFTRLELYEINKDANRQLELYHLTVKSQKRIPTNNNKLGSDFISVGVSTHVDDSPLKLLQNNMPLSGGIFFQPNKIKQQGDNQEDKDYDSVFIDTQQYKYAKMDRPQSANDFQQQQQLKKHTLELRIEAKHNQNQINSNQLKSNLELDTYGSSAKDLKENDGLIKNSKRNQKDVVSTFKIIKLDSEENILKKGIEVMKSKEQQQQQSETKNGLQEENNNINSQQKNEKYNTSQIKQQYNINNTNDQFKIQNKQFYDVKNNPLSFLKSSSLTQQQTNTTNHTTTNSDKNISSFKNKCHSLDDNDDLSHNKNNNNHDNNHNNEKINSTNKNNKNEITIFKNINEEITSSSQQNEMNKILLKDE